MREGEGGGVRVNTLILPENASVNMHTPLCL